MARQYRPHFARTNWRLWIHYYHPSPESWKSDDMVVLRTDQPKPSYLEDTGLLIELLCAETWTFCVSNTFHPVICRDRKVVSKPSSSGVTFSSLRTYFCRHWPDSMPLWSPILGKEQLVDPVTSFSVLIQIILTFLVLDWLLLHFEFVKGCQKEVIKLYLSILSLADGFLSQLTINAWFEIFFSASCGKECSRKWLHFLWEVQSVPWARKL